MTVTTDSPRLGVALRTARGKRSKAEMARLLEVGWMTYDMWEKEAWIPGDEQAEKLAGALDRELPEIVWMLYRARIRAKGLAEEAGLALDRDIPGKRDRRHLVSLIAA